MCDATLRSGTAHALRQYHADVSQRQDLPGDAAWRHGLAAGYSPRLLSLVGTLPKNAYGSPIVNEQGQVVAVYVEKADLSKDKSLASLADRYHYALCLDSLAGLLETMACPRGGWYPRKRR